MRCSDETLYAGYTNDITRRLEAHNRRKGGRYTRGRTPVALVYLEKKRGKGEALKRELEIKKMSREAKLALCRRWSRSLR